jgi:hypothetical protein
MPPDAPSLRETIESAMSADAEVAPEVVEAPVEVEVAPEHVEAEPQETAAEAAARARDEKGRFATKPAEKAAEKPAAAPEGAEKAARVKASAVGQGKPATVVTPPAVAGTPAPEVAPVKAPQSFKPAVRELAQKLPAEFRPILDEAVRIDNDAKRALNDSAQARQFSQQVQQSLAPYEGIARAAGMDSMAWAGQALQMVAGLYQGPPQHKAALIAQAIAMSGASIDDINAAMQGQAPAAHAQPQSQQQPQDVNRLVEQAIQQRVQQARQVKAETAWQEFTGTQPEFLETVFPDMQEIVSLAERQGRNITYQQAYDRACKLNEEVSGVLAARKTTEATRAQAPTVQRSKTAGSSIKATPVAAATRPAGPRSLRDEIEAAIAGQRT